MLGPGPGTVQTTVEETYCVELTFSGERKTVSKHTSSHWQQVLSGEECAWPLCHHGQVDASDQEVSSQRLLSRELDKVRSKAWKCEVRGRRAFPDMGMSRGKGTRMGCV